MPVKFCLKLMTTVCAYHLDTEWKFVYNIINKIAGIFFETEVDPDLIGGVIARVGDLLLDGSVRTQLQSLGAILRKGSAS